MAELKAINANLRLLNEESKSVCFINNISPDVEASKAAAFTNAIETIYNNGECSARMSIVYQLER